MLNKKTGGERGEDGSTTNIHSKISSKTEADRTRRRKEGEKKRTFSGKHQPKLIIRKRNKISDSDFTLHTGRPERAEPAIERTKPITEKGEMISPPYNFKAAHYQMKILSYEKRSTELNICYPFLDVSDGYGN